MKSGLDLTGRKIGRLTVIGQAELRKLLEAKDCAVRAKLYREPTE